VEKQSRSAARQCLSCHVGYPARNDGDTLLRTCSCSKNPPVPALSCNHRRRASGQCPRRRRLRHRIGPCGPVLANFLRELLQGFSDVAVLATDTRAVVRLPTALGMAREHPHPPRRGAQSSKHGQFSTAPPLLPPSAPAQPSTQIAAGGAGAGVDWHRCQFPNSPRRLAGLDGGLVLRRHGVWVAKGAVLLPLRHSITRQA
jgi:hypothetical protein